MSGAHGDPLVTVVVPAYNAQAWIDETLRSVRSQTYANLEIIVVDDGSHDRTIEIVELHVAADPRIRLVRQANGGVARARNNAIAQAAGELVAPIDADDLWERTKIAKQVEAMARGGEDLGLVYTWYASIDADSCVFERDPGPVDEGDLLPKICERNVVGNGSSPLMRKRAVLEAGGYEPALRDARAQGCEDILLYFRIAESYKFAVVPEHLTGYRQLQGTMSSDVMQMWRSFSIVAKEMKAKYPKYTRNVDRGEAFLCGWLFWKALKAGKPWTAVQLYGLMLMRAPGYALHFARLHGPKAVRKLFRGAGGARPPRSPFPIGALPGEPA